MQCRTLYLFLILVLFAAIHACKRWRGRNWANNFKNGRRGHGRWNGGRRRGGNPPCTYFTNNPDEQNDEARERQVKRNSYGQIQDLQYTWIDPYADRPQLDMTRNKQNYLSQIGNERKVKCGLGRRRRWKRQTTRVSTRKEYRQLTADERTRFHTAVQRLKRSGGYDTITMMHQVSMAPGAHNGSMFLPWHAQLCLTMEVALQNIDPGVSLVYWDNTFESRLGNRFRDSCLFDSYSLGQLSGAVTTGAFANFMAPRGCQNGIGRTLTRRIGNNAGFYTSADFRTYDRYTRFEQIAGTTAFEDQHALTHVAVGGHMSNLSCSPVDPLFFLFHCFVDYLFFRFRRNQTGNKETDYVRNPNENHRLTDELRPFNMTGLEALKPIAAVTYQDSVSLIACSNDTACTSPMLWCRNTRCTAKIKRRTRCVDGSVSSCYCPSNGTASCRRGMCTCGGTTGGGGRGRTRQQGRRRSNRRQGRRRRRWL